MRSCKNIEVESMVQEPMINSGDNNSHIEWNRPQITHILEIDTIIAIQGIGLIMTWTETELIMV